MPQFQLSHLQHNSGWFGILVPPYLSYPGNWLLKRVLLFY